MGAFCFVCASPGVSLAQEPGSETFVCSSGHRSPRAFLFDGRAVARFEDEELVHETAAALLRRGRGATRRTLLFLRQRFPLVYSIPAGHVQAGQEPEAEMRRELLEETGLPASRATRLWPGQELRFAEPCRRGADWHVWHAFEVEAEGHPRLSDEGRVIGWFSDDEVRELCRRGMVSGAVQAILTRLGVVG